MLAFDLNMDLADFYDRLRIAKGPSFGMIHSLACPFMYLAHYDLVTENSGREYLQSAGINPELIRFSIGTEDVDAIIGATAKLWIERPQILLFKPSSNSRSNSF